MTLITQINVLPGLVSNNPLIQKLVDLTLDNRICW